MQDELYRNYYAVIPSFIRYDPDLKANAKLLYGEITALSNDKGYCWATNDYFAKLYNVSKRSVIEWIQSLAKKGYINVEIIYKENSKEISQRVLKIPSEENFLNGKNIPLPSEENFTDGKKVHDPHEEKFTENNINNNNIYIKKRNIKEKKEDLQKSDIDEILDYYNNCYEYNKDQFKIKKIFRLTSKNKEAVKLIKARLNENYTVDDFKDVIFYKYYDFIEHSKLIGDKKSLFYYRPETLFNSSNFAKYKQEYELWKEE